MHIYYNKYNFQCVLSPIRVFCIYKVWGILNLTRGRESFPFTWVEVLLRRVYLKWEGRGYGMNLQVR